MKMNSKCICVVALTALLGGCTSETKTAEAPPAASKAAAELPSRAGPDMAPLTAEDSVLVSVTATVQAIDVAKRELTLKGPLGNVNSFTVDKQVKRLDELKVGDEVTADYFISLAGELRAPTEEERRNPISIIEGVARGPKGSDPAAGGVRTIRVVAEVVGLDLPSQTVTLKGPKGDTATVRAKKLDNFKKLRLGDTIVVTYTEALAISVEKVSHPRAN
jgi:hypothetical protein